MARMAGSGKPFTCNDCGSPHPAVAQAGNARHSFADATGLRCRASKPTAVMTMPEEQVSIPASWMSELQDLRYLAAQIVHSVAHEFDDGDDKGADELFAMLLADWNRLKDLQGNDQCPARPSESS